MRPKHGAHSGRGQVGLANVHAVSAHGQCNVDAVVDEQGHARRAAHLRAGRSPASWQHARTLVGAERQWAGAGGGGARSAGGL